jgi:pimeloyl-ACP methyl ester carboxylesterase
MASNQIQFVETKYGRLAYRIDGSGGDVPLVLLQRFRGTISDWDPAFTASLTSSRRVIRFDSAGVGRSDGRTPESVSEMAEIARAFLKAINTNKADLLGWSMGGFIGQHAALDAPEIVRRLIIAGSGPGGVPEGPQPHPKVFEIATKPQSEDRDFLFLFFTDSESGRAAGKANVQRTLANSRNQGRWAEEAGLLAWLENARLDFFGRLGPRLPSDQARPRSRADTIACEDTLYTRQ